MPRIRNPENAHLPERWQIKHGAYYYRVPPGQEAAWEGKTMYRLGASLTEAYSTWAKKLESVERKDTTIKTVGQLLKRYLLEVITKKSPKQAYDETRYIQMLTEVFSEIGVRDLEPHMIYQYYNSADAKTSAKRELSVLSHAYTKAIEWGIVNEHPFKGKVVLEGRPPRTRYVEDWEIVEALALPRKPMDRTKGGIRMIQAYIRIKLLTGISRKDLLLLKLSDLKEDGIHIQRHKVRAKTGIRTIYNWSPALKEAVEQAKALRPVQKSEYLFCTRLGTGYYNEEKGTAEGFDSIWHRFMARVLEETKVQERFTEHDLRAKCASDADTLEHARALLSHADSRLTERVYRRKPERVKPIR